MNAHGYEADYSYETIHTVSRAFAGVEWALKSWKPVSSFKSFENAMRASNEIKGSRVITKGRISQVCIWA